MAQGKKENKLYLTTFFVVSLLLLLLIGGANYLVDPFFQFRVKDRQYILNPQFVNAGLIKNYDYNTVVMGSSMVQNYDMSVFREQSGVKPLKLSLGGLNVKEMIYLYSLIDKSKVNTFVINIDLPVFNVEQRMSENHFPHYLSDNDLLSKMRYLWGYESSVRYTPLNIAFSLYVETVGEENISPEIKYRTSIDCLGYFAHTAIYNNFEKVKNDYLNGVSVSHINTHDMDKRMFDNMYSLIDTLDMNNSSSNYIFVLPSYSALYWYHTQREGYYSDFINFVHSFVHEIEKYPNAKVLYFYDLDEILDLGNYIDITHYAPVLSDKIVRNLFSDKYRVTSDNVDASLSNLDSLIVKFSNENKEWLPAIKK